MRKEEHAVLAARGLRLARVSGDDVSDRERLRAAFREYVKPEDAERFGLKEPPSLTEDQLVLVGLENNQPVIHALHEIPAADLPSVAAAERELRNGSAPAQQPDPQQYLRLTDLARRWGYTKQGVQNLARREDFPRPCFAFNGGRVRLWALRDIEIYERDRPELRSEADKILKVRRFAWARKQGGRQSAG